MLDQPPLTNESTLSYSHATHRRDTIALHQVGQLTDERRDELIATRQLTVSTSQSNDITKVVLVGLLEEEMRGYGQTIMCG